MIKIFKGRTSKGIFYAVLWLVILAFLFILGTNFAAKVLEIGEIGYLDVYFKNLSTGIVTGIISFGILFVVFAVNLFILRKNLIKIWGTPSIMSSPKSPFIISFAFSIVLAIVVTLKIYPLYLQYYSSLPFGSVDPIIGQDIGYYVFQRPFLSETCEAIQLVLLFQIVYSFVIYSISYLKTDFLMYKELFKESCILNHLLTDVTVYFISLAISFKFTAESILFGEFGTLSGAGFTEVMVWQNYYRIAPFVLIFVIVVSFILLKRGKLRHTAITLSCVPAFWIATLLVATVVQLWFVKPYEVSMQRYYINHNMNATKAAFNLENVEMREFDADDDLTLSDLAENSKTIENIRITDINQTLVATNSLQSLRSFYTFTDTDIIPYDIGGKKTPLMVSVREFDEDKLQQSAKSYINKKLRYTHGFGIVANQTNSATEEGQPNYIIKDIPTLSSDGAPQITQPRIYFGEKTNDYVLVGTKYNELDYIEGDKTIEYSYDGRAGIPLSFINRIIFSANKLDPMLLMSSYITGESRLLTNRNVLDRVKKAAPFLSFDNDPYIVINDDGTLSWVIDIYTTTNLYPYSQTYNGINYIRNSAKAVVDAYDGSVTFYITDMTDPIIRVYSRMYPSLFSFDSMPQSVYSQCRYPEYMFKVQAEVFKMYHVSEPEALYSNSDVWVCAKEKYAQDETTDVAPYYNLMDIGAGDDLVLMQPYTPQGKENLVAWLAASSRFESFGKLTAYTFPKGKTVYGTLHIENKIDNDPSISKEISLWNQGGSKVIKGNLLVIPIKNSLLYVEPVYITAKNSAALPEIKRIVVAFGDKVAMEPTLRQSLEVLFGAKQPTVSEALSEEKTVDELINDAVLKYGEIENFSADGNFESFGQALDELGEIINKIKNATETEEKN